MPTFIDRLFGRSNPAPTTSHTYEVTALTGDAFDAWDFNDPHLRQFLQGGAGGMTEAGVSVTPKAAMRNTTVMRCVSLIAFSVGTLPLHLRRKATKEKATDHPLFRLLHRKPNAWQTAFEFRSLMQQRMLGASGHGDRGDAFALIVRSGRKPLGLVPLATERVTPRQRSDWSLEYEYRRPEGGTTILQQRDVFHLRYGLSEDGISGISLVKQAAEAIGLALQTERAAARLFRNGMLVGGMMSVKNRLSDDAFKRLKEQMDEREGASQAHKWIIGEEGLEAKPFSQSGRDSQHIEQRKHQIEEIARPFGVPRPLLGVDETSWGSGIDVLGQFFVRFALNPHFEAWQQAIERCLLDDDEAEIYEAKFNVAALLNGSMKDQAEYFAKALGSGGHQPWMGYEEVRETVDLPEKDLAPNPISQSKT